MIFHQRFANYQDNEAWLAYQAQLLLPGSTKCTDRGLIFEAWLLFQVLLVFLDSMYRYMYMLSVL